MKTKTSVTLSTELIATIDNWTGEKLNRSLFLERAPWQYIARLRREQRDLEDLKMAIHLRWDSKPILLLSFPQAHLWLPDSDELAGMTRRGVPPAPP